MHVYKHLPVRVCVLSPSCHTLEGRGIEGLPPESCVYLVFLISPPCMTSVTSRNSSTFQFCCNDLQKRTAITFSHPKVLQELGERGEWLKRLITVGEGGARSEGRGVRKVPYLAVTWRSSESSWRISGIGMVAFFFFFNAFGEKWYPCVTISSDNKNNWKISWNFWVFNYV